MKLNINKKFSFFVISVIFLVLTIISIQITYARYVTSLTAKSTVELGSWLIRVNNQNIMENSDISAVVTPIFDSSEYISDGVLAPTSTGNVEINLDYKEVTVPFQYDISVSSDDANDLEDFKLIGYSIDDGETTNLETDSTVITATIAPTEATRTRKLKLLFSWYDGEGEHFDDTEDTAFAASGENIKLNFVLKFTQLVENE